jgi:copper(I)-binding protein
VVLFIALATLVGFRGVSGGGTSVIAVRDPWVRPAKAVQAAGTPQNALAAMNGGSNSAVYLTITNTGDGADKLVGVQSSVAGAVEMHRMAITDNVATMRQVNVIEIPKGGEVRLDPNGYHLILVNVRHDLNAGGNVDLTLTFEHAGPIQVSAQVRDQ